MTYVFFHADLTNQHGIDKVDSYFAKLVNITPRTMGDTCSELVFMGKSRPTHTHTHSWGGTLYI